MAKSKRTGKSHASGYARYKTAKQEQLNRLRKLNRAAKEQPNNEQIPLAIKNIAHRRNVPKAPAWSSSTRKIAQLVKAFTGKFSRDYFSTDPKVHASALRVRNENWFKTEIPGPKGSMFSLKERTGWN